MNISTTLEQMNALFISFYEETRANCEKLKSDKKEYETVPEGVDDDDLDCYFVPNFVNNFLKSQSILMNSINLKYENICKSANKEQVSVPTDEI